MRSAAVGAPQTEAKSWALDKSIASELQRLKERDNHTNHKYLATNYAIFIATKAATLWSYQYAETSGLGYWLTVPMTVLAVIIIGVTIAGAIAFEFAKRREAAKERAERAAAAKADADALLWRAEARSPAE